MITVQGLSFTYAGADSPAVQDLSFSVDAGQIFGFLGPSGAGKSTTLNVLTGLLRGWRGSAQVLDRPLEQWGRDYYQHVAASFELPNHYNRLTARQNLNFFRKLYAAPTHDPETVMAYVGLGDVLDHKVETFSKGMKNRLTIARSLLNQPKLWFLDEPTAGLDPMNAKMIRELIAAERRRGTTVVITTHDMTVADTLCDQVAFIVDGRLAECDVPETLRHRYGARTVLVEYGPDDAKATAEFDLDDMGQDPRFAELIRTQPLHTIHSQECTLADVFIKVTGRALA